MISNQCQVLDPDSLIFNENRPKWKPFKFVTMKSAYLCLALLSRTWKFPTWINVYSFAHIFNDLIDAIYLTSFLVLINDLCLPTIVYYTWFLVSSFISSTSHVEYMKLGPTIVDISSLIASLCFQFKWVGSLNNRAEKWFCF